MRNPETVAQFARLYRNIDDVDTMVGLFAEHRPAGTSGSRTRRSGYSSSWRHVGYRATASSTVDFRPEDVLPVRHGLGREQRLDECDPAALPGARRFLPRDGSAFAPWRPVARPVAQPAAANGRMSEHPGLSRISRATARRDDSGAAQHPTG